MNLRHIATTFCALILMAGAALAQVNTASLTGLVKDSTDALVTGAKVSAQNVSTGAERSTETNGQGYYFLADLPVGEWEISIEKTGFQKAVSRITLDATEKGRQDFSLAVGTVATVATVQASAPLLSTEDASIRSYTGPSSSVAISTSISTMTVQTTAAGTSTTIPTRR